MIWAILLLATILRLISLDQSLWLDEAIIVNATTHNSLLGMITEYSRGDFHPPGYFVILWFWTKAFGISEIAVRMPSVIFGVLTVYLTYLIGKRLKSTRLGLLAALFLAVNPLHIYYSQEARMYAFVAFAVSLNFLFFLKLINELLRSKLRSIPSGKFFCEPFIPAASCEVFWFKNKERAGLGFSLSFLLLLSSDYLTYFIIPTQLAIVLWFRSKQILKTWIILTSTTLLFWLWWLPFFWNQITEGLSTASKIPQWRQVVGAFGFKPPVLTYVKFITGRISHSNDLVYLGLFLPAGATYLWLTIKGYLADNQKGKILLMWLTVPILLALITSLFIPVFSYFRLLFVLPPFLLLTSLGLKSFKGKLHYAILSSLIVIELFCSFTYLLNPQFQREDWKGAVSFLGNSQTKLLFENTSSFAPFEYYSKGTINNMGALKNFPANSEKDLKDLNTILNGNQNVYLMDYLVEISDPNRLVNRRLVELGYKQTNVYNFNGVGLIFQFTKQ